MVFPATTGGGGDGWADMKSITLQVLKGRWFVVFTTCLLMSVSGASYMFGLYSNEIKSTLGYDQTTLNLLGFFKDLGSNIGILSGLINQVTPPWVVLVVGGVLNFFGYFMIWLAVTKRIGKPSVWNMCLYICIGANSHTFTNTGALVTSVMNFPESRGMVMGLNNGYIGLSAAIITQLFHAFLGGDTKSLILLMASLPMAVSCTFLRVIRVLKGGVRQPNEIRVFCNFLCVSLCLAGFLMVMIIVQNNVTFTQTEYGASVGVTFFLLFLPIVVVVKQEYKIWKINKKVVNDPSPLKVITQLEPSPSSISATEELTAENQASCWKTMFRQPDRGEDYTILQALFSIDMLLLFLATICGLGGTLTVMDNLGQIGTSLGYPLASISNFVSLSGIWNYLGVVVAGVVAEIFVTKYKFPRPLMHTLILLLSCVGYLLIAFNVKHALYFASIILGACCGAQWPLVFTIISELFGLKYYSVLYNFGALASPIGSYLLNVSVTGYLYDREAMKQLAALGLKRQPGEELNCSGGECYRLSFIILTVVTLFGTIASLFLVLRTMKFYKSDIYKKFREVKATETGRVIGQDGVGMSVVTRGEKE
ncbi:protein NUCLEAR FUSION DEFECTIVE 4-like [Corylus avellana]|uniref:protein NUCLEAR FUSION DEFECTIVE 4-like n=1 Tax=Corylus avellana TaxID=13451 RepID=UPI001E21C737|nr:protein NUCLEAR FUSION DEFECTIVE 4-like [Corylus avellana]XP_059457694.1 protein NUCLEAR FUSION DEFECTIVE 4-like [Corylus avellana]